MEKNCGEVCNSLILTSKIMPEWIPRQEEEGKFVMGLLEKEIGEVIFTARFAMASTIFSNAEEEFGNH